MSIPGVPNLLKNAPRNIGVAILGDLVGRAFDFLFPAPKWGIYYPNSGDIAMQASSVVELEIFAESVVSNYQIETGSFTTYNKVVQPRFFGVRITRDGAEFQQAEMQTWLENEVAQTTLFDVVCPTKTWRNVTLVSYRELKSARSGAAMMTVDCVFQEVRELPAKYTDSQPTVRVSPVENRTVQATGLPPL